MNVSPNAIDPAASNDLTLGESLAVFLAQIPQEQLAKKEINYQAPEGKIGMLAWLEACFKPTAVACSLLGDDGERCLRSFMWAALVDKFEKAGEHKKLPLRILEIGTHKGVSAALLAQFGHVTTIDLVEQPSHDPEKGHGIGPPEVLHQAAIWDALGANGRITALRVQDNAQKWDIIQEDGPFDVCLIDGDHTYEGVKADADHCQEFGRMIFHDFRPHVHCHRVATVKVVHDLWAAGGWMVLPLPNFAMLVRL